MTPTEESIAFYYELGLAMSQWAHVENNLCVLALSFCHANDRNAVALGFVSMENFRSKLAFTNAIVEKKLSESSDSLSKEWDELCKKIGAVSTSRNKVAHRQVRVYPQNGEARRYALVPWIQKKPKTDKERREPPTNSLFIKDINKIRFEFFALATKLTNFRARVHGEPEPFPRSTEVPMDPMTTSQLANHLRHALGTQKISAKEKRKLQDAENAQASLEKADGPG